MKNSGAATTVSFWLKTSQRTNFASFHAKPKATSVKLNWLKWALGLKNLRMPKAPWVALRYLKLWFDQLHKWRGISEARKSKRKTLGIFTLPKILQKLLNQKNYFFEIKLFIIIYLKK